jgi:Uma2 family endonuclease
MTDNLKMITNRTPPTTRERPGWIPPEIADDWDPDPYAYQTEEELMPAGGLHGQLLAYIIELLRHVLEARGLMLLLDTFLLYRDEAGVKQRIAPDLLLMPFRFPPPSAYDLDREPPPGCLIEVTSPKSHLSDLEEKVSFYLNLGVSTYLVIDAITPRSELRSEIELHLWRSVEGQARKIAPDAQGRLALPEMGLSVSAQGQRISFMDAASGEVLLDMGQLLVALEAEREARREAEARAEVEAQARREAEARLREMEARLKRAGLL